MKRHTLKRHTSGNKAETPAARGFAGDEHLEFPFSHDTIRRLS
jgi:hypothetical protein